ncbi:Retinol dehydrogenase 12 [Galdieria sulphuraria]|uniref:Short-chain dehydrogenase/reductase (SDR) family protein n=1 Tax=Galdieria sulphuraria TaxID=130081 RepID=M2Y071_GALSU|nr:short-chain dehydrogenase/reductase (SDR) family protein [Galdieria sulphuraria]EME29234.1 short-chain dehydrogenase/reductase (SDR) family protein [Galdieria sulphuraria]GJD11392.1 Retinol dehydrogenase 12 [Galdieria sulphuraria]|eukprot:XP_005705754.1 short-chain dehydrogenase/reductase (SDR) family protein [Galdieria sulphuraria]
MALVQLASLKVFLKKPFVTSDVLSDFLFGRFKLMNCAELENSSLKNKTALVTGCNTGIGYATCLKLAKAQARILICCRTMQKSIATADSLRRELGIHDKGRFCCFEADMENLDAVTTLAQDIIQLNEQIHFVILNAGVMQAANKKITKNGLELHFAVNHMSHFLLTYLLMPQLIRSAPCRIIVVTSNAYEYGKPEQLADHRFQSFPYIAVSAYAQSKLANILFAYELKKRFKDKGIDVFAVHPGAVLSDIYREEWLLHAPLVGFFTQKVLSRIMRTPQEGGKTIAALLGDALFSSSLREGYSDACFSNLYWKDCKPQPVNSNLVNDISAEFLWRLSISILKDLGILNDERLEMVELCEKTN